ncbi:MAG: glycoside hydrolase family 44 protein [Myxococcales bacterium]
MRKKAWAIALGLVALIGGGLALRVQQVARRSVDDNPAALSARVAKPLEISETIYDGGFRAGWQDWGWGPHEIPQSGPAKVMFAGYGGIVLHHSQMPPQFGGFSFRYKPAQDLPEFLSVTLQRTGALSPQVAVEPRHVVKLPDGWREVLIDWSELDPSNLPFDRVVISARSSVPSEWVLLDQIVLTKSRGAAGPAPIRDVDLGVACDAPTHPISPLIYGASGGDEASGQSAQRFGGNPMSRLNWDTGNSWNLASDWFFENVKIEGNLWDWIDGAARSRSTVALVVPMIGWVAKDETSVGFPRAKFPAQRKYDSHRPEAGDGFRPDGSKIQPGAPTATSIAATPEVIGRWIRRLREKDAARGSRGVQMYILDNEPSLWHVIHRDVHPEPVSADELLDRTVRYATEIRKADPEAVIAGPAEWGWRGYLFSGKDQAADESRLGALLPHADRRAHGDVPLIPWYLQQLAQHERTTRTRLLDVLDVHFYPAADGLYGDKARVDPEAAELRVRSTRALWDPTYRDESWIAEPIRLIPRLKEWVAANYPGRKISIGEWSFGADEHISGGLATAEALGRFGEQGLDSAFYWGGPKTGTPTFWAFRAFRNFDGAGGRFLDISLKTRPSGKVSLFASRDASGGHAVLVVVNADPVFAAHAHIELTSCGSVTSGRVFEYGRGSSGLKEGVLGPSGDSSTELTVQPFSFAVVDLQLRRL